MYFSRNLDNLIFNLEDTKQYSYVLATPAVTTPVTLAEAKEYLRVDSSAEDALITNLINVAVLFCEKYTKRDLINKTYKTYRDNFSNKIIIKKSKLQSITSIQYYNNSDSLITISPSVYYFTDETDFSSIYLKNNQTWPSDNNISRLQNIIITFVAGFGPAASDVPADLKQGLLQHIVAMYERRGDCEGELGDTESSAVLPQVTRDIYNLYRIRDIKY